MSPVSLTLSVNSSTPTTVTYTPVAGLVAPVKAGTVVGTVSFDKTGIAQGAVMDIPDLARFSLGGIYPNYKIVAKVDLVDGDYAVGVAPLPTGGELKFTVAKAPVVVDPPPVEPPPAGKLYPGMPGFPVGYAAAADYPGSLTKFTGGSLAAKEYRFVWFDGVPTIPSGASFYGCRFSSNWVDGWNVLLNGKSFVFRYCSFTPKDGVAIPHAAWPASGANAGVVNDPAYQIAHEDAYQYGLRITSGQGTVIDFCDIWGFGNAIDLVGGSGATITNTWIHDAGWEGSGSGQFHTDGIGYLDGGGGPKNVLIRNCTVASLGNTNGIAFQKGSGYSNIVVDGCYLTGFGYTVDMCHGIVGATGLQFTNNLVTRVIKPVWGSIYPGNDKTFPKGSTSNVWSGNKDESGKFILPTGNVSATDWSA